MDEPSRMSDDAAAVRDRHRRLADDVIRDEELRLYIDGEWVESDSGKRLEIVDPTTDERLASAPAKPFNLQVAVRFHPGARRSR